MDTATSETQVDAINAEERTALEMGHQLMRAGAVAINLQCGFLLTDCGDESFSSTLASLEDATSRLKAARKAANAFNMRVKVLVCTEAKRAVAITSTQDLRDRRYLTGMTTAGGHQVYCGGLSAAIERALVFAPNADVVCYMSSQFDPLETREFASAVQSAFPGKELGFGYYSNRNSKRFGEGDHAERARELRHLGYDYYFHSYSGSIVFPGFPAEHAWVMFDDAARAPAHRLTRWASIRSDKYPSAEPAPAERVRL